MQHARAHLRLRGMVARCRRGACLRWQVPDALLMVVRHLASNVAQLKAAAQTSCSERWLPPVSCPSTALAATIRRLAWLPAPARKGRLQQTGGLCLAWLCCCASSSQRVCSQPRGQRCSKSLRAVVETPAPARALRAFCACGGGGVRGVPLCTAPLLWGARMLIPG